MRRFAGLALWLAAALPWRPYAAAGQTGPAQGSPAPAQTTAAAEKWTVTVGQSLVLDSPLPISRLSVADDQLAEAVAISPREALINGKTPGETTLIVWQENGARTLYDLTVRASVQKLDALREQIAREFPGGNVDLSLEDNSVFVRGTVPDTVAAARVIAMAATLGKPVNLLRVVAPEAEPQILVKVRFANVDRSVSTTLGFDMASGAFHQSSALGVDGVISTNGTQTLTLSEAVNIFLLRKDLNLAAAIQALQSKDLLEILAEPTVPAVNGKPASFLAGGEFPFPMVQPSTSGAVLSLSWREYGVRLNFLPILTPRGAIRLQVTPEVSSLDYTHSVTVQGFTVPALATRRVQTEVELESGQSFVIAGLIDNEMTQTLSRVPGLASLPILGKLFQSKSASRSDNELLVIVTPEIVRPIPEGQPLPELKYPQALPSPLSAGELRQPGLDQTGGLPPPAPPQSIPVEQLLEQLKQLQPNPAAPPAAPAAPAAPAPAATAPGGRPR